MTIHSFNMKMVINIMVMVSLMVIMTKFSSMYGLLNFVFLFVRLRRKYKTGKTRKLGE